MIGPEFTGALAQRWAGSAPPRRPLTHLQRQRILLVTMVMIASGLGAYGVGRMLAGPITQLQITIGETGRHRPAPPSLPSAPFGHPAP